MRLIDADKLKDKFDIKGVYSAGTIWDEINDTPTVYDVDKVVKELLDGDIGVIETEKAIAIVKGGLE